MTDKRKNKIIIAIVAVMFLIMAAIGVYEVVKAAIIDRESNVHREITINLNGGTSGSMFWYSQVDRDSSKYTAGTWIWGTAGGVDLRPKDATEDRQTKIYNDNEEPSEGTFTEHIDCVGATPYVWIEAPIREGYTLTGWSITSDGEDSAKEMYYDSDEDCYYFNAGAYATTGDSDGSCTNIEVVAEWEPINIRIDFNVNGGEITEPNWSLINGEWIRPNSGEQYAAKVDRPYGWYAPDIKDFGLFRTGHHFTGWKAQNEEMFENGVGYRFDWTWYPNSYYNEWHKWHYVDLAAQWELNYAKLDYNVNGGRLTSQTNFYAKEDGWIRKSGEHEQYWAENIYYDETDSPYNDTTFNLVRAGYKFVGWRISGTDIILDQDTSYHWTVYCNPLGIDLANGDNFEPQYVDLLAEWEKIPEEVPEPEPEDKPEDELEDELEDDWETFLYRYPTKISTKGISLDKIVENEEGVYFPAFARGIAQGQLKVIIENSKVETIAYDFSDAKLEDKVFTITDQTNAALYEHEYIFLPTYPDKEDPATGRKTYKAYVDVTVKFYKTSGSELTTETKRCYYYSTEKKIKSRIRYQSGQAK